MPTKDHEHEVAREDLQPPGPKEERPARHRKPTDPVPATFDRTCPHDTRQQDPEDATVRLAEGRPLQTWKTLQALQGHLEDKPPSL